MSQLIIIPRALFVLLSAPAITASVITASAEALTRSEGGAWLVTRAAVWAAESLLWEMIHPDTCVSVMICFSRDVPSTLPSANPIPWEDFK